MILLREEVQPALRLKLAADQAPPDTLDEIQGKLDSEWEERDRGVTAVP
jgi:hypothetical protein